MLARRFSDATDPPCGLLLVGHGSREPSSNSEFLATARLVAEAAPHLAVEPSFLEFAEPSISQAFEALVGRGVRRVVIEPVLLFSAGHIQRDIPAAVACLAAKYPDVSVAQADHLGCHDALVKLSQRRYDEAMSLSPMLPLESTGLVMVGRGSRDDEATAEMLRFVELRRRQTCVALIRAAFIAMAEPPLQSVLDELTNSGLARIVVQPHLLFGGVLVDRVGEVVERHARLHRDIHWVTTGQLGVSRFVAQAVLDRASKALAAIC